MQNTTPTNHTKRPRNSDADEAGAEQHKRQRTNVDHPSKRTRDEVDGGEKLEGERQRKRKAGVHVELDHEKDSVSTEQSASEGEETGEAIDGAKGVSYLRRRRLQELARKAAVAEIRGRTLGLWTASSRTATASAVNESSVTVPHLAGDIVGDGQGLALFVGLEGQGEPALFAAVRMKVFGVCGEAGVRAAGLFRAAGVFVGEDGGRFALGGGRHE
ncbi:hypothetical protein C8R44DRAFT_733325 [Mycena epipterygia]|nr:hypothetical protein C8R44DRAFT_733325 [Mycena epipterygia]